MPSESFRQRAGNCALLTITVICICVLVLSGVMVVQEYNLAKFYEPTTCKINNITYTTDISCRFCESKDKTKEKGASVCVLTRLPCIQIAVSYGLRGKQQDAILHPDSLHAAGPYTQCSYTVCLKTYDENKQEVERYASQWRRRLTETSKFPCFYNTETNNIVIVTKMHTQSDVIHSMLWPSLVIAVCGVIFLRLEMRRRGLGFCESTDLAQNRRGPHLANQDACNGGSIPDVKQTLLQIPNNGQHSKVHCSLLKNHSVISSSMPALDNLKPIGDYTGKLQVPSPGSCYASIGKDKPLGSSLSVDGLKLHNISSEDRTSGSGTHLLSVTPRDKCRQDNKAEFGSSTGSQGSKIMGLETPV